MFSGNTSTRRRVSGRPLTGCVGTLYAALWVGCYALCISRLPAYPTAGVWCGGTSIEERGVMTFGEAITQARKDKKLSQKQVAAGTP